MPVPKSCTPPYIPARPRRFRPELPCTDVEAADIRRKMRDNFSIFVEHIKPRPDHPNPTPVVIPTVQVRTLNGVRRYRTDYQRGYDAGFKAGVEHVTSVLEQAEKEKNDGVE